MASSCAPLRVWFWPLAFLAACLSSDESVLPRERDGDDAQQDAGPPAPGYLGADCDGPEDCASGLCDEEVGQCATCSVSDNCSYGDMCFRPAPAAALRCMPKCEENEPWTEWGDFFCARGLPRTCEALAAEFGDYYCDHCGCGEDGYCRQRTCHPVAAVGETCTMDDECASRNCGVRGVCNVALGAACTHLDCDECLFEANGGSVCRRPCDLYDDCGGAAPICIATGSGDASSCVRGCEREGDPACPGVCERHEEGGLFCNAGEGSFASGRSGQLYDGCSWDGDCANAACATAEPVLMSELFVRSDMPGGICSMSCDEDAPCAGSGECIQVPCEEPGQDCGKLCFAPCEISSYCERSVCRVRQNTRGEHVQVCDPKRASGEYCRTDAACASGSCVDGACKDRVVGKPFQTYCTTSEECASGVCWNALCW